MDNPPIVPSLISLGQIILMCPNLRLQAIQGEMEKLQDYREELTETRRELTAMAQRRINQPEKRIKFYETLESLGEWERKIVEAESWIKHQRENEPTPNHAGGVEDSLADGGDTDEGAGYADRTCGFGQNDWGIAQG